MTSILDSPLPAGVAEAVRRVRALLTAAPLGVAFSGGVDSSVLLALAVQTLGPDQVVAILGVSPSLGTDDRQTAHKVAAADIGARLVEVHTREGEANAYRVNGPDRCFHCKTELFSRIAQDVAPAYGLAAVAYGENADDARRPDRPGSRAAADHKVLRPLADAGLDKAAVRAIARALRLPSADKPAAPCLASRLQPFRRSPRQSLLRSRRPNERCGPSDFSSRECAIMARWPASSFPLTI